MKSPLKRSEIVENALDLQFQTKRAKYHLKWGAINMLILTILLYDIKTKCPEDINTLFYWIEMTALTVSTLSMLACFTKYFWHLCSRRSILCTKEQKFLLSGYDNDKSFIVDTPKQSVSRDKDTSSSKLMMNWHSSFNDSFSNSSPTWNLTHASPPQYNRKSITPKKPQQYQQSPLNSSWHSSFNNSAMNMSPMSSPASFCSPFKHYGPEDVIEDEKDLNNYLREVSIRENSVADMNDLQNPLTATSVNSFWNYCNTAANYLLRTSVYQLSPAPTQGNQSSLQNSLDDSSFKMLDGHSDFIKGISSEKLSEYVTNLRVWISTTILQRLVTEMKAIDDVFKNRGFIDIQIGKVSLDRLKKLSEMPEIMECMPKLSVILPFLSLISNQEYLVQRIKDLAKSSIIADYRWNSGYSYSDNKFDDHLPSDAAVIFHLFCVYLDYQLLPLPQSGGRPFHSRYIILGDESRTSKEAVAGVNNKAQCAIYYTSPNRPKFNFISEKQFHNCTYNRNNLFYVIIQFLLYMKNTQDGQLEGVNLGKTGVNILCVIED